MTTNKQVVISVIGDLHFRTAFLSEVDDFINRVVSVVKKNNPDFIVLLGDILHTHSKTTLDPFLKVELLITNLAMIAPLYILVGNHDRANNKVFLGREHFFNAYKKWNNITIVDSTILITIKEKNFIFVPYVQPGRFIEAINTLNTPNFKIDLKDKNKKTRVNCIFAHQEFRGCKMGSIRSVEGDTWDKDYPLVVSGHIHDFEFLDKKILYVGTPYQQMFGESLDKKICKLTFGDEIEPTISRTSLGMKTKINLTISASEFMNYKPPKNSSIKITIADTEANLKALKSTKAIEALEKLGIIIHTKRTDHDLLMNKGKDGQIIIRKLKDAIEELFDEKEIKYLRNEMKIDF